MTGRPPPLRPRVRRVPAGGEELEPVRQLKVRAFHECFDRGNGFSALIMEGLLHPGRFEIHITGAAPLSLPALTGRDAHGPFACLNAQEHAVGEHHAVRVDADAHDVHASLAAISYFELPRDRVARAELAYASRWYSVYFNELGLVDGCGSGGPRSLLPGRLPS